MDRKDDGSLILKPVEAIRKAFEDRRELSFSGTTAKVESGARYSFTEAFTAYERFLISGEFSFSGTGSFGLAFDYNGREEKYKLISLCPSEGVLRLCFNEGTTPITETAVKLEAGKTYTFTYVQEGSVGTFYIDGLAALTVRLYGVSGKPIRLFSENNSVEWKNLYEYTMPQEYIYEEAA